MPHVSSNPLPKDVYKEITQELGIILASINKEKEMLIFLEDLLTKTERTMLSKRFAIVRLLNRGWTWNDICQFLKVSKSTVNRLQQWLDKGGRGFEDAFNKLDKKENIENFWNKVDKIAKNLSSRRMRDIYR